MLSALLPDLLAEEQTAAVELQFTARDGYLRLVITCGAEAAREGSAAGGAVGRATEWVGWLGGTVRLDREPDATSLVVVLPLGAATGE